MRGGSLSTDAFMVSLSRLTPIEASRSLLHGVPAVKDATPAQRAVDDGRLPLPADHLVDYVRAWQRKDLASSADGLQPAPKPASK